MVQHQFDVKIQRFCFDNTSDYFNQILSLYFLKEGISHEPICVYAPQLIGMTKENGHIMYATWALLFSEFILESYWDSHSNFHIS